jgi:glycosyltransferase involved in cell wall biosynthesis
VQFDVAASGENGSAYAHGLRARAASLSNVNWLGSVPRERMPHVYQQMTCLCCTSAHEGFPNTFIEAWSHGRPVVSSFDPDGLIASLQLGVVARQVPDFVEAIRSLEKSPETWRTASRNARAYYLKHHPLDIAMAGFERVFQQLGHNASSTLS